MRPRFRRRIMEQQVAETKSKVCVIGAGAAGLCAARYLAREPGKFEFQVFERTGNVGGTWNYTDRVGLDDHGLPVHSSMYKNLRTNLPRELMNFPDYQEIKGEKKSCVTHKVILDYLNSYADHFKIRQFIQFHTEVESVKLESGTALPNWRVGVKNVKSGKTSEAIFDAVMICNGHFFDTYVPHISGLNNFKGQVLHSHAYRKPEDFTGKTVILLGGASSGIDIGLELVETASHVYLSHNKSSSIFNNSIPKLTEVSGIVGFENEKFILKDDSAISADVLIFCTGYHISFPFLDESCGISVDENFVTPLYKHTVNAEHPSMCIIGIPHTVIPFPLFAMQVQYFLSTLKDKGRLPTKSEMLNNAKLKSTKKRKAHELAEKQWAYNDDLARAGGFQPLPCFYKNGYEAWSALRKSHIANYKNYNLMLSSDGLTVQLVQSPD